MCCSIPNTILKDVKCIGESLQKISWTLLMIKDRQNGKNLPPPLSAGFGTRFFILKRIKLGYLIVDSYFSKVSAYDAR